jgi:hypothetical protein
MGIENALERVRQEASVPEHRETPARHCRGCGNRIRRSADAADGLCVAELYPANPDSDCSSLFTMWLLGQGDLAPKVLARPLSSAERSVAIDEWLMSK